MTMKDDGGWLAAAGRWMLALIFVLSALKKLAAPHATIATIAAAGMPLPTFGYVAAVAFELMGSVALVTGWHARSGAVALAVFCIAAGFLIHFHPTDPAQMVHFLKNVAIAGGLLQVAAFGPGRLARRTRSAVAPVTDPGRRPIV